MFGWFSNTKKEQEAMKEETRKAFEAVKKDIDHVGRWIKHLHSKDSEHHEILSDHHQLISQSDERLATIEKEMKELKNLISSMQRDFSAELFRQPSTAGHTHRPVEAVEKGVQMPVYAGGYSQNSVNSLLNPLAQLTAMERAVVYVLLSSELKLSYEDLAVMLGKDRSTLRSQINTIKQKCEGLIEEHVEKNGKKRVFIPEEIRKKLVKTAKMRGVRRTSSDEKKDKEGGGKDEAS